MAGSIERRREEEEEEGKAESRKRKWEEEEVNADCADFGITWMNGGVGGDASSVGAYL
jgi:mannose-6-phosphate isomerase-like protein (cupin superfamily)